MSNETALTPSIGVFVKRSLITDDIATIQSGKDASVYRCRAHPRTGRRFVAAKVYRPLATRAFRNDAIYRAGRAICESRVARAVDARSAFGLEKQGELWARAEHDALARLRAAGARVPEPLALHERTLLLEWLGDDEPAPQLQRVRLDAADASRCRDLMLREIALWLEHGLLHADLSPFNILWHLDAPVAIDFPQAVDARSNPHARALLRRDLANLGRWCARRGAGFDAEPVADELWRRWERAAW